jgi:hypothetical protein
LQYVAGSRSPVLEVHQRLGESERKSRVENSSCQNENKTRILNVWHLRATVKYDCSWTVQ